MGQLICTFALLSFMSLLRLKLVLCTNNGFWLEKQPAGSCIESASEERLVDNMAACAATCKQKNCCALSFVNYNGTCFTTDVLGFTPCSDNGIETYKTQLIQPQTTLGNTNPMTTTPITSMTQTAAETVTSTSATQTAASSAATQTAASSAATETETITPSTTPTVSFTSTTTAQPVIQNLGLNATVIGNSVPLDTRYGASYAIDHDTLCNNIFLTSGTLCFITFDLGKNCTVLSFKVFSDREGEAANLSLRVSTSSSDFSNSSALCVFRDGNAPTLIEAFTCPTPMIGQFVKLQWDSSQQTSKRSVCELQIFGY